MTITDLKKDIALLEAHSRVCRDCQATILPVLAELKQQKIEKEQKEKIQ